MRPCEAVMPGSALRMYCCSIAMYAKAMPALTASLIGQTCLIGLDWRFVPHSCARDNQSLSLIALCGFISQTLCTCSQPHFKGQSEADVGCPVRTSVCSTEDKDFQGSELPCMIMLTTGAPTYSHESERRFQLFA